MKFGLVIFVCTLHEWTVKCCYAARAMSRPDTEVIVVFNGQAPVELDPGIEVAWLPERLGCENATWPHAYALAVARGWDWCAIVHDDHLLDAPGWEAQLETDAAPYRIGLAGWSTTQTIADTGANQCQEYPDGSHSTEGPLAVFTDGCGIVFNVALFRERGFFSDANDQFAGMDLEACCWALAQRHAVWGFRLASFHHPPFVRNSRQTFRFGWDTKYITDRYQHLFPATVAGEMIHVGAARFSAVRER